MTRTIEQSKVKLNDLWGKGLPVKLRAFELKTLQKNEAMLMKIPLISRDGIPHPTRKITLKIHPSNVDENGDIFIRWDKDKIKARERRIKL